MTEYTKEDCIKSTQEHIDNVKNYMKKVINLLDVRSASHDSSKLEDPELATFVEYTPKLADTTYGSLEYKRYLNGMKVALDHHYKMNKHHPEHFANGIDDMTLMDLIEMLCDWKAATLRHNDGNITKSLEINKDRFEISPQLMLIFQNTINFLEHEDK